MTAAAQHENTAVIYYELLWCQGRYWRHVAFIAHFDFKVRKNAKVFKFSHERLLVLWLCRVFVRFYLGDADVLNMSCYAASRGTRSDLSQKNAINLLAAIWIKDFRPCPRARDISYPRETISSPALDWRKAQRRVCALSLPPGWDRKVDGVDALSFERYPFCFKISRI
jgi:hypothetical protein